MATTVGQHSVAAFTSPVNGTTPIDANTVRGNDNTVRSAYVDHDADPGIHVQSSSLASRPAAGTAGRKWITEDSGVYTLWFDDGTNWHPVSSENVALTVLAGENLVKGDVVKVTGWNNGQDLPEVAKVSSASDVAFAIMTAAVSSGSMGYATNTGIVQDVNTNSFAVGTILYPNTSGGFTSTKPTSGNYQTVAFVLRQNANNGVIFVEFSSPRIVERSDNTASTIVLRDASGNFSAGTITAGALTSTGLVTFASLKGTGATTVTNILDEDNMASDSATALATQQSIKAYVDAKVATVDTLAEVLANGNTTGANNIIVSSGQKITTNTIDETTAAAGVTIDSVLLKDDVVNATDIEVDTISANNGTLAVTLGSTGVATIAQQPILSSLTASQAVFTDASKGLVSNAITGTGNVVMSASPTLTGTVTAATLNATTLGGTLSTAAQPNVTSVGTLTSLTVSGDLTVDTSTLKVDSANDRVGIGTTLAEGNIGSYLGKETIRTTSSTTHDALVFAWEHLNSTTGIEQRISWAFGDDATANTYSGIGYIAMGKEGSFVLQANRDSYLSFATAADAAPAERVRINSSGNLIIGNGESSATPSAGILRGTDGSGTDIAGAALTIQGGRGTGSGAGGAILFATSAAGASGTTLRTATERMRLDASGNLGLGVTPSAGGATANYRLLQVGADGASSFYSGSNQLLVGTNVSWSGGTASYAVGSRPAALYNQQNGAHSWSTAASGTGTITFTQAMTLDASGYLKASNNGTYGGSGVSFHEFNQSIAGQGVLTLYGTNASTTAAGMLFIEAARNTTNNTFYAISYYNSGASAYKLRVADSGAIATAGSVTLGSVTPATSGVGVQFPATQSASSDANTLDDYEEGTWTPGISFGNAAAGLTYGRQGGTYTKVGRQVTVCGDIILSNKGSSTGDARITGLPFTVNGSSTDFLAPCSLRYAVVTFANQFQGYAGVGTTTVNLEETTEAGVTSTLDHTNFDNSSQIMVSLTYYI